MKGIIVRVARYVAHDPRAPRIPAGLFQNPKNRSKQNDGGHHPHADLQHGNVNGDAREAIITFTTSQREKVS
jgi:hypothetical protein